MAKRALVVVTDGFEDIEAIAPIDVLNRVGVEVTVASLKEGPILAAYGTRILSDTTLGSLDGSFDAIIIPGGKANATSLAEDVTLRKLIQSYAENGKLIAAICAAPSHVLGESAGILRDREATGDPGFNAKLKEYCRALHPGPVCIDSNVITATGPGSALMFALFIARELVGEELTKPFAEKWGIELPAST